LRYSKSEPRDGSAFESGAIIGRTQDHPVVNSTCRTPRCERKRASGETSSLEHLQIVAARSVAMEAKRSHLQGVCAIFYPRVALTPRRFQRMSRSTCRHRVGATPMLELSAPSHYSISRTEYVFSQALLAPTCTIAHALIMVAECSRRQPLPLSTSRESPVSARPCGCVRR
jgi:hypothetical protein